MKWSFKLLTVAGIGVYVHITFLVLIAFVFSVYFQQGGTELALQGTALIIAVFACVLLHEFGHALTARRFGVKAKDIVLLPIGGVARLDRMPEDPRQELLITVAGPLVNVAIAAGIWIALLALRLPTGVEDLTDVATPRAGLEAFLRQLLAINIFMAVFNLIPAFPMDGGRILRSVLAFWMRYDKATRVAAGVGQAFAALFGLVGILNMNLILVLIAVFVFMGASGEALQAQMQALFRGLPASAGVVHRYRSLAPGDSLGRAVEELLAGSQLDFPVVDGETILGILSRQQLVKSLRERGPEAEVRDVPLTTVEPVEATTPLLRAWEEFGRQQVACLPVRSDGRLIGWLTRENVAEVAMVREALAARTAADGDERLAAIP